MKKSCSVVAVILTLVFLLLCPVKSYATTSQELKEAQKKLEAEQKELEKQKKAAQSQQNANENKLNEANNQINQTSEAMGETKEQIDTTSEEIVGLLTDIDFIKEDISEKEIQIVKTNEEYEQAKQNEETLYESMVQRVKFMYEKGNYSYVQILLTASSYSDALNKAQYVEQLYEYDRIKLGEFIDAKEAAQALGIQLEEERSELEASKYELEEEEAYMEKLLAQYKAQYADYEVKLAQARQNAAVYTARIKSQQASIASIQKQLETKQKEVNNAKQATQAALAAEKAAAEKAAAEKAAARTAAQERLSELKAMQENGEEVDENELAELAKILESTADVASSKSSSSKSTATSSSGSNTTTSSSTTTTTSSGGSGSSGSSSGSSKSYSPPGSATGSNVANYACQFVGNPYVSGGTSLTNGADCSGFVYSVYKAFGISVPRTSWEQGTHGREVSYSNAQPGDVIYYGGHVGIYIGGGQIVHASTQKTGIKISSATYRSIISVRRFL